VRPIKRGNVILQIGYEDPDLTETIWHIVFESGKHRLVIDNELGPLVKWAKPAICRNYEAMLGGQPMCRKCTTLKRVL
jgi:hypothetical protein